MKRVVLGKAWTFGFKYKCSHVVYFLYDIHSLGSLYKKDYLFIPLWRFIRDWDVSLHILNLGAK